MAAVMAVAGITANASAAQLYTHQGNNNPISEGWTFYDVVSGQFNPNHLFRATINGFTDGDGTKYWKVHDDNDAQSWTSRYQVSQTGADNISEHWRLSALVRGYAHGGGSNSIGNAQLIVYSHHFYIAGPVTAAVGWSITFDNDSMSISGNTGASGGNGGTYSFDLGPGFAGNGFNWIEMIYDPTQAVYQSGTGKWLNSGADLYINGNLVMSNVPLGQTNNIGNYVMWGDMIFSAGGYGGGDYSFVQFERSDTALNPLAVPEPATAAGMLGLGGLALLRRRRR